MRTRRRAWATAAPSRRTADITFDFRHSMSQASCISSAVCYDYASACARPRKSKARNVPIAPCDLSTHSFCSTPGNSYPWHAVRRFVKENQGLMRRMYGEERHSAILKAEIENTIDYPDYQTDYDDIIKTKLMYAKQSRTLNVKPHFRPIQTTPATADKNKKDNPVLKVKPLDDKETNKTETTTEKGISYKTKLESIANIEINNLDLDVITLEAVIKQSIETNSIYPNYAAKSEPLESTRNGTASKSETTTTENLARNTTEPLTTTDGAEDFTTENSKDGWKSVNGDTSTLPPTLLFSEHDKANKNDRVEANANGNNGDKKEEFHMKPHPDTTRPSVIKLRGVNACSVKEEVAAPFWANNTHGEVLALLNMYPFEQYVHLETCTNEKKQMYCREGCSGGDRRRRHRRPPTASRLKGPRKQKSFAYKLLKRGLAKSFAYKCEQQYRLHRLLAYDPRNECRGIFADWFRFPSCCVCKCYDVPVELRAASRSPRVLPPRYGAAARTVYEDARDYYTISGYDDEDYWFDFGEVEPELRAHSGLLTPITRGTRRIRAGVLTTVGFVCGGGRQPGVSSPALLASQK
ncbi:Protein spaetzle 4 [Eumeta japonica]|uniref:Protein spaetzle 4 n=1 Tax=Eumeta variegata TaxID=151549 RepID=A0A4C1UNW3_EUMVA|nr:Protein spaetzle 4 [Eumeta japonica]